MDLSSKPLISVIMPVFNRKKDLHIAIDSILNQTIQDLELIIINDGSTDGSAQIIEEFAKKDQRIILCHHKNNLGLVTALNNGLKHARGKYIARMDQDDISLLHRLQTQVEYMDTHPNVGICGAWMKTIGSESSSKLWQYPESHDAIYARMLFTSALAHPTVMMKSETLSIHGLLYDMRAPHAEDYDLWSRSLPVVCFANVPEVLLHYRLHATNTGITYGDIRKLTRIMIYRRILSYFKIEPSENDLLLHEKLGLYQYKQDVNFLLQARDWLEKLAKANRNFGLIIPNVLDAELGQQWTEICNVTSIPRYQTTLHILKSSLRYRNVSGVKKIIRTLLFLFKRPKNSGFGDNNEKK